MALWVAEPAAHLTVPNGRPQVLVTSNRVGQNVEVRIDGAPDGEVRVELRLDSPGGSSRSLPPLSGTVRNGTLTLQGPVLGPDDRWHALQAKVVDGNGKVMGVSSVSVR